MDIKSKIFCIGLSKTGTSSFHSALQILGFKSVHWFCYEGNLRDLIRKNNKEGIDLLSGIENYDAYSDWTFPEPTNYYEMLDKQYPGSKFVLTIRDKESWLKSLTAHHERMNYGWWRKKEYSNLTFPQREFSKWSQDYDDYHAGVFNYFQNRKKDFLILRIIEGDGWEKLCPFLDLPIPASLFPSENKKPSKKILKGYFHGTLTKILSMIYS